MPMEKIVKEGTLEEKVSTNQLEDKVDVEGEGIVRNPFRV